MTDFSLFTAERTALERIFDLAEGYGGGSLRARKLLCAWWNADEFGGFDFADLWSFDDGNRRAALTVIQMIGRAPQGTYADSIAGFGERMKAIAERQARALKPDRGEGDRDG